jgi:hypothetical protein
MYRRSLAGGLAEVDEALTRLSLEEHRSLLKLLRQMSISSEHEEKLVWLRLVERRLGGLGLTELGEMAASDVRDW